MRRAAVLMVLAGLAFSTMLVLVKSARAQMGALDLVMWRGVAAAPLALVLTRGVSLRLNRWHVFAVRTVLGFAAMVCYYTAAKHLFVANLSLIGYLQPLLVGIAAPWLLGAGERTGGRVWMMLVVGFAGCAVIATPDLAAGSAWGLVAVAGAFLSAGARITLRALVTMDHPGVVVFWFQTSMSALGAVALLSTGQAPSLPPAELWPHVLGIGAAATLGQLLMSWAHHAARAAAVAAFSYSSAVWAVLADIAVFGAIPAWNVIAGGVLIVAAGLWLVARSSAEEHAHAAADESSPG